MTYATDTTTKTYVTAIFNDRAAAERAYDYALQQGYRPEDINVIMSEDTKTKYYPKDGTTTETTIERGDKSMEGLAVGGALGGTVIGIAAAIAAIGTSLLIPGLNLIVAGPLAAGLAGAGAGSITGGLVGALIGLGIPEDRAKVYEKGIKSGGIVIGVKIKPGKSSGEVESAFTKFGGDTNY